MAKYTIALAGNPNCGKTTLFNALTGSTARIGNWPGVTVEKKEGSVKLPYHHTEHLEESDIKVDGIQAHVVDLPGIYGLYASSDDERVTRDYLVKDKVDAVINIIDASNIERNLFLTLQLIETGIPVLLVLNMIDLAEKRNIFVDPVHLSKELNIPVIAANATDKKSVKEIINFIGKELPGAKASTLSINYGKEIASATEELSPNFKKSADTSNVPAEWYALKVFELDQFAMNEYTGDLNLEEYVESLGEKIGEEADIVIADKKYDHIGHIVNKAVKKDKPKASFSEKIDKIVMNRFAGIPIFLGAMFLVFWATINIGGAFIDFFDISFGAVFVDGFGSVLEAVNAPEWLIALLAGGIGGGIQTVATFVPIIFTMFFMLSLLEDSGYISRAAFVMDRLMRKVGLPGKAFVPMLLGFGCTVPAVMATRTLETKRDRFTTIFMSPLMSCGARLPVYALFAAALFPAAGGQVVFSLYIVGIVLSILTGLLVKKTLFTGEVSHFVMELPAYHIPKMGRVLKNTWTKLKSFVIRAGKVIILMVIVLSLLNSIAIGEQGISFGNDDSEESLLSGIGKTITPIFEPMGISQENWPATVGLFTGLFAKEAVVGTVNSLYAAEIAAESADLDTEEFDLGAALLESVATIPENLAGAFEGITDPLGLAVLENTGDEDAMIEELEADPITFQRMRDLFNPSSAYAYLLFILIYFPCVAAFGAAAQEMGNKLAWLSAAYLTVLAWIIATLFYQLTFAFNPFIITFSIVLLVFSIAAFVFIGKRLLKKVNLMES